MINIINDILRFIIVVMATLLVSVMFILTPTALKAAGFIACQISPAHIHYTKLSGTLLGPIQITGLDLQLGDHHISVDRIYLQWRLSGLLRSRIDVKEFKADNINIISTPQNGHFDLSKLKNVLRQFAKNPNQHSVILKSGQELEQKLKYFLFPINLTVENMQLRNIHYHAPNTPPIILSKITFHGFLHGNHANAHLQTQVVNSDPLDLQAQLMGDINRYQFNLLAKNRQLHCKISGEGDTQHLSFTTNYNHGSEEKLTALATMNWAPRVSWDANLIGQHLNLSSLDYNWPKQLDLSIQSHAQTNDEKLKWFWSSQFSSPQTKINWNVSFDNQWKSDWKFKFANSSGYGQYNDGNFQGDWLYWAGDNKTIHLPYKGQITNRIGPSGLNTMMQLSLSPNASIPYINIPRGQFLINLDWQDKPKPHLEGEIQLHQGNVVVPQYHLTFSDIKIHLSNATHDANELNYTLQATSEGHPLQIRGTTQLTENGFPSELRLEGNNIHVFNTPEYSIYASPNLRARSHGKDINIDGSIEFPQATVKPHDFHSITTLANGDIVVVNKKIPKPQSPWNITTNVSLTMGNDVQVDMFGIRGKFDGKVNVISSPHQPLLATGRIFIRDGIYTAVGSTLAMSPTSNIQYANTPILNPNLDLRASKTVSLYSSGTSIQQFDQSNYTIGISLQGSIKSPKLIPFSVPATLSQADILSYLLWGDTSTPSSSGNYSVALRALDALNTGQLDNSQKKPGIIGKIRHLLGFSELGIESNTTIDAIGNPIDRKTAVVIGKPLSKRLYVRYSRGIPGPGLTETDELIVRYLLSKHWAVQTNSNTYGKGADLLYTLERD